MPLAPKFSRDVTRAVFFLEPVIWVVAHPIVGAAWAMSWAGFSWRDFLKLERNVVDRTAATRDGLLMLKIASYGQRARIRCI